MKKRFLALSVLTIIILFSCSTIDICELTYDAISSYEETFISRGIIVHKNTDDNIIINENEDYSNKSGFGIGLSIASKICSLNNCKIEASIVNNKYFQIQIII